MNNIAAPEVLSLAIAVASLMVSVASALIARSSLALAKQMGDREEREWKERKWSDMYLKANEVYDFLDRFRVLSGSWAEEEWQREWNELMHMIRQAHAMAVVFPINAAIDAFVNSTALFKVERAVSQEALSRVFSAVELIREKARMNPTVVD